MEKKLQKIRKNAQEFYVKQESVSCPYFKDKIEFTSEGFDHIRYKRARSGRSSDVQAMRYKILPLSVDVLSNSKTLQEYEEQRVFIDVKKNKKREKILKEVKFFGFIAIIKTWKVKVIIRQVGNGKKHFWSIILNWKTRKSKEGKKFFLITQGI